MKRISTVFVRYLCDLFRALRRNIQKYEPNIQRLGAGYDATLCRICTGYDPTLEASAAAWYNTSSRKDGGTMDTTNQAAWETLTPEQKRRALYDRQVATLKTFLEHGAITQAQHDKSLHDLTVKMGYGETNIDLMGD